MNLTLVTAPAVEPVTGADMRDQVRSEDPADDAELALFATAARQQAEAFTRRAFVTQTWSLTLDGFPSSDRPIYLPKPPLLAVDSVTYLDADGQTQTWPAASYRVTAPAGPFAAPGKLRPAYGETYPATQHRDESVTITFRAGYGDAGGNVPEGIRHAIKLAAGHFDANREDVVVNASAVELPHGSVRLLWPFRSWDRAL